MRNYRSTPQIVGLANLVARGAASGRPSGTPASPVPRCTAQGEAGPAPALTAHPDDPAEAAARGRARSRALIAGGHPAARSPSCSAPTRSPRPSSRRWPTRASPTSSAGASGSSRRKEVRDAILLLRGAARGDDGSKPLGELVRDVLGGAGWTPRAARPAAVPSASGGSRCRRSPRWPTTSSAAAPEARLPDLVARARRAGRRPARPGRAGRHPRLACTRPRAWSGTPCSSSAAATGSSRSRMAEGPEAIEEERRLLYVGADPGPPRAAPVLVGGPQPRRPRHPPPVPLPRRRGQHPRRGRPLSAPGARTGPAAAPAHGRRRRSPSPRTAAAAAPS